MNDKAARAAKAPDRFPALAGPSEPDRILLSDLIKIDGASYRLKDHRNKMNAGQ